MTDPATSPTHPPQQSLVALVLALRDAGLPVGTTEALDVTRLLRGLAERGEETPSTEALRCYLRPVLCKSSDPEMQSRFDAVFDDWIGGSTPEALRPPPPPRPPTPPGNTTHPGSGSFPRPAARITWSYRRRTATVAALVAIAAIVVYLASRPAPVRPVRSTDAAASSPLPSTPASKATVPSPDASAPVAKQYNYGYSHRFDGGEALRPGLAWTLSLLPFLALAGLLVPAMSIGRRRAWEGASTWLPGWARTTLSKRLVFRLPDTTASQLDRHVRGPASERSRLSRRPHVDLPRTVAATIASFGIPRLHYRHARLRPGYLVLVEASDDEDLAVLWSDRLRTMDVDVDLRRFTATPDGTAPACLTLRGDSRSVRFDALPAPPWGQRLVLVSDGGFLLDAQGQWRDWVHDARLYRWPVRALFSPRDPRDFLSGRLATLDQGLRASDPGFLVLPMEDSALDAWSTWLATGHMPTIQLLEPEQFPRLIERHGERRYLPGDDPGAVVPEAAEVRALLAQLQVYLGENGFYWLCCCAVPPKIDVQLTRLLGEELLRRSGTQEHRLRHHLARNYRLLSRLPWIRRGAMPDWLRIALLARLPEALQMEVRQVVEGLLSRQVPATDGSIPLAFGLPRASAGGWTDTHRSPADGSGPDALYVGFLAGLDARQLLLRVPGPWRHWIGKLGVRVSRWQRAQEWLAALGARVMRRNGLPNGALPATTSIMLGLAVALPVAALASLATVAPPRWSAVWRDAVFADAVTTVVSRPRGLVTGLAFDADDASVLTATRDGEIQRWDASSGLPAGTALVIPGGPFDGVVLSPSGRLAIALVGGRRPRLFDATNGRDYGELRAPSVSPEEVTFNASGTVVALVRLKGDPAAGPGTVLDLQDPFAPAPISNWIAMLDTMPRPTQVAFGQGPDAQQAFGVADGAEILVEARNASTASSGNLVGSATGSGTPLPLALGTPSEGASGLPDGSLDIRKAGGQVTVRPGKAPDHIAFSPDGTRVISIDVDGLVQVWDADTGEAFGRAMANDGRVRHMALSSDGSRLATIDVGGTLRAWDTDAARPVGRSGGLVGGDLAAARFDASGSLIVTVDHDNRLRKWDAMSATNIDNAVLLGTGMQLDISADGQRVLIITGAIDDLIVRSSTTGEILAHDASVTFPEGARFDPTGRFVQARQFDSDQVLLDSKTLKAIPGSRGTLYGDLQFSPDGRRMLAASRDRVERLWRIEDRGISPIVELGPAGSQSQYAFDPTSARILAIDARGARVLSAESGQALSTGFAPSVQSGAFSPDGREVLVTTTDGFMQRRGLDLATALGPRILLPTGITKARYSPDGSLLISLSPPYRLWDAATGRAMGVIARDATDDLLEFSPRGDRVLVSEKAPTPDAGAAPTSTAAQNGVTAPASAAASRAAGDTARKKAKKSSKASRPPSAYPSASAASSPATAASGTVTAVRTTTVRLLALSPRVAAERNHWIAFARLATTYGTLGGPVPVVCEGALLLALLLAAAGGWQARAMRRTVQARLADSDSRAPTRSVTATPEPVTQEVFA